MECAPMIMAVSASCHFDCETDGSRFHPSQIRSAARVVRSANIREDRAGSVEAVGDDRAIVIADIIAGNLSVGQQA